MAKKRRKTTTSQKQPLSQIQFIPLTLTAVVDRKPRRHSYLRSRDFSAKRTHWEYSEVYHPPPGKERETSNNLAEYLGLIAILEHLIHIEAQHEPIMVYGDSNLVIQQM
jgi:hypothetical protein